MQIQQIYETCNAIRLNIESVIIGKSAEINLALTAILAGGHVLLEDVPGTGKTMLAKSMARSFDCEFGRIQFTPDLLPSDLTGINFYSPKTGEFTFRRGSLFANIVLADEINRATPRTQSGLLESMEEKQITVDGETFALSAPYFVIATQNPVETQGTFPLPEAQLDRFMMKFSLGYPEREESLGILKRFLNDNPAERLNPVCSREVLLEMQESVKNVYIHDDLLSYITDLAEATRKHDSITLGVSTRGSIALMKAAQAYAAIMNRSFVTPDDIKCLLPYVFSHRLILRGGVRSQSSAARELVTEIMACVTVPVENWQSRG